VISPPMCRDHLQAFSIIAGRYCSLDEMTDARQPCRTEVGDCFEIDVCKVW
jgi:hypothetical protein